MAESMTRFTNAFNYYYERELSPNETVILKMPSVSANARSINDIAFIASENVTVYATIQRDYENPDALWQAIGQGEEINRTATAIKLISKDTPGRAIVRVILS